MVGIQNSLPNREDADIKSQIIIHNQVKNKWENILQPRELQNVLFNINNHPKAGMWFRGKN